MPATTIYQLATENRAFAKVLVFYLSEVKDVAAGGKKTISRDICEMVRDEYAMQLRGMIAFYGNCENTSGYLYPNEWNDPIATPLFESLYHMMGVCYRKYGNS